MSQQQQIHFAVPQEGSESHECPQCNNTYKTVSGLKRHIRAKHTNVALTVRKLAKVSQAQRLQKRKEYTAAHSEERARAEFNTRWSKRAYKASKTYLVKQGNVNPSGSAILETRAVMLTNMWQFSNAALANGKRRRIGKAQMYTEADLNKLDEDPDSELDSEMDREMERAERAER
ncbi:hypothetical protein HDU77_011007, partial [Chytriomyces hyalinus]